MLFAPVKSKIVPLPFFTEKISAGFPSPAEDHVESSLDLAELLITNPPATFYLRVSGESMIDAGIFDNDILVVDRSLDAKHGDIIVAKLNAEFTVKRLYLRGGQVSLIAENPKYQAINLREYDDFEIFGVVSGLARQLRCSR